jgi:predicted DsbA family dithiol-disulfide isomerase
MSAWTKAIVGSLLAGDADRQAVQQEIASAQQMGVSGVPCFILDNKYAVMGAQDAETIADAIRQVAANKKSRGDRLAGQCSRPGRIR